MSDKKNLKETSIDYMMQNNLNAIELDNHFLNLAKTDALNSIRTNDTIKEKLTATLLTKSEKMSASELLSCIEKLDSSKVLESYKNLFQLFKG